MKELKEGLCYVSFDHGLDIQGERAGYEGVAGEGNGEGVEGVWSRGIGV